jgi:hypothetical protein
MAGFNFTELLEKASQKDYYEFEVPMQVFRYLIKSQKAEIAQRLNEVAFSRDGKAFIKLEKKYDLSVKEHLGMRNDRFSDGRRKILIAEIGQAKRYTEAEAEKMFKEPASWGKLPSELQVQLNNFFTAALAESTEDSRAARQITTVIQQRLFSDWLLEWTLDLPKTLLEPFVIFFEGEVSGWKNLSTELGSGYQTIDDAIDVLPQQLVEEGKNNPGLPDTSQKVKD